MLSEESSSSSSWSFESLSALILNDWVSKHIALPVLLLPGRNSFNVVGMLVHLWLLSVQDLALESVGGSNSFIFALLESRFLNSFTAVCLSAKNV